MSPNKGSFFFRVKNFLYYGRKLLKEVRFTMILLSILIIILALLVMLTILAISIGGVLSVILFGDVIVCIVFIILIIKRIIAKRKTNKKN